MSSDVCEAEAELRRWSEALKACAAEWRLRQHTNDRSNAAYLHILVELEHTVAITLPIYFSSRTPLVTTSQCVADEATVQEWSSLLVTMAMEHALLGMLSFLELQSWLRLLQTLLRLVQSRVTLSHVIPRLWGAILQRIRDHASNNNNTTTSNVINSSNAGAGTSGGAVTLVAAPIAVSSSGPVGLYGPTSTPGTASNSTTITHTSVTGGGSNSTLATNALCAALQLLRVLLMYIPGELEVQRRQLPHPTKTASIAVRVCAFQALPYIIMHQKTTVPSASATPLQNNTNMKQPVLNADMLTYLRRGIECPAYAVHEAAVQAVREVLELGVSLERNTSLTLLRMLLDVCSAFGHASPQLQEDAGRAMGCLLAFLQADMTCCSVTVLQSSSYTTTAAVSGSSFTFIGSGSTNASTAASTLASNNSFGGGKVDEGMMMERIVEWLFTPEMTRPTQNALATALATSLTLTTTPQNVAQALRGLFVLLIPIAGDTRAYMPRLLVDAISRYAAQLPSNALRVGLLGQLRLYAQDAKEDRQVLRTALAAMTAVAATTSSSHDVALSIAHTVERLVLRQPGLHGAVSELLAALAEHCVLLQEYLLQRMIHHSRGLSSHLNASTTGSSSKSIHHAAASFALYAKAFLGLSSDVQATPRFVYPLLTVLLHIQLAAPPAMSMTEVDYLCTEYVFRLTQLLLQRQAAQLPYTLCQRLELATGHYLRLLVSFPAPLMAYFRAASAACALLLTRDTGVAEAERMLLIGMLEGQLVGNTGQRHTDPLGNTGNSTPLYATVGMLDRLKGEVYKVSTVAAWGHRRDEGSVRWLVTQALKDLTEVCAQAIPIALDDDTLFPRAVASFMHDIHALRPTTAQKIKAETAQRAAQLVAWGVCSLCTSHNDSSNDGVDFCREVLQRIQELYLRYGTVGSVASTQLTNNTSSGSNSVTGHSFTRTTPPTQSPHSPAMSAATTTTAAVVHHNVGGIADVAPVEPSLRLAAVQWNVLVILYYILQAELQGRMKSTKHDTTDSEAKTRCETVLGETLTLWRDWALQWAATQPLFVVKVMAAKVHGCISVLQDEVDNHTSQLVQRAGSIEEDVSGLLLSLVEVHARQHICRGTAARTFPMLLSCLAAAVRKHGLGGNPCSLQTMALMLAAVRLVELDVSADKGVLSSVIAHAVLQLGELGVDPIVLLLLFAFFSLLRTQHDTTRRGVAQQPAPFLSPASPPPLSPLHGHSPTDNDETSGSLYEVQCDMTSAMLLHVLWSLQGGVVRPNVERAKLSLARRSMALVSHTGAEHEEEDDRLHDGTKASPVDSNATAVSAQRPSETTVARVARVMNRYLRDAIHRYTLLLSHRNAHMTATTSSCSSKDVGKTSCALPEALPFAGETLVAPVAEGLGALWMTCLDITCNKISLLERANITNTTVATEKHEYFSGMLGVSTFLSEVALMLGGMTSNSARAVWAQLARYVLLHSCSTSDLRLVLHAMRYIIHTRPVALQYGPAIPTQGTSDNSNNAGVAMRTQPGRAMFHTRSLSDDEGERDNDKPRGLYLAARMDEDTAQLGETILGRTGTTNDSRERGLSGLATAKGGVRKGHPTNADTGIPGNRTTTTSRAGAQSKRDVCAAVAEEMYGDAESLRVSADAAVKASMLRLMRVVLARLVYKDPLTASETKSGCVMGVVDKEVIELVLSAVPLAENLPTLLRPAIALLQAILQYYGTRYDESSALHATSVVGRTQTTQRPCLLPWKSQFTAALRALVQSATFAIAPVCALVRTWLASNLVDDASVKRVMRGVAVLLFMQDRLATQGRVPRRRDASAILYLLVDVLDMTHRPHDWAQTRELVTHTLNTTVAQELLKTLCEAWTARLAVKQGHIPLLSFSAEEDDHNAMVSSRHARHNEGQSKSDGSETENDTFDDMSLTTLAALRLGPLPRLLQMLATLFSSALPSPTLSLRHAAGVLACTTLLLHITSSKDDKESIEVLKALSTLLPRLSSVHQEMLGDIAQHILLQRVATYRDECGTITKKQAVLLTRLMQLLSLSLYTNLQSSMPGNDERVALVRSLTALQPGSTLYTRTLVTLALQCDAPCDVVVELLTSLPVDAICMSPFSTSETMHEDGEVVLHYLRTHVEKEGNDDRPVLQRIALSGTAGLALVEHACSSAQNSHSNAQQENTLLTSPLLLPTVSLAMMHVLYNALCETRDLTALLEYMWPTAAAGHHARHYMLLLTLLAASCNDMNGSVSEAPDDMCPLLERCETRVTQFMTYVLLPAEDTSTTDVPFAERLKFCVHYILRCSDLSSLTTTSESVKRLKKALAPIANILTQQVLRLQASAMREVVRALPQQGAQRLRRFLETGSADVV